MFDVYYFKKLTSTSDKAKLFCNNCAVVAEIQTKGRGRFNRKWRSSKGGLWMSVVIKPIIKYQEFSIQSVTGGMNSRTTAGKILSMLKNTPRTSVLGRFLTNPKKMTFVTAIAINKAIKKMFKLDTKIKWPNDILFNGKKLCGILAETTFRNNSVDKMIIGIGLNVNNRLPSELKKKAISLKKILHKDTDIKKIVSVILKEFFIHCKRYKDNDKKLINDWKRLSDTIGRNVRVKTVKRTYYGKAYDVDKDCNLMLRLKNGQKKKIIEGDIFY